MAVYLTKSMMSRMNRVTYPNTSLIEEESFPNTSNSEHWERLMMDSKIGLRLSREKICRVCAKTGCTPLSSKINEYDIMAAISSITNVTINVDDSLPKYICPECLESLKVAMQFKRSCEIADKKFRKILNPMGDPSLHSYPYSKHDFQLLLHQMKLKRMESEQKEDEERRKRERLLQKKDPKNKEFKCSPCDMAFPNKEELVAHRRERQCMRRACDICGQLVRSIAQHMRHNHAVAHKCPTCGKEFPMIARLKNHMLVHTNTFNFFCDLCPYKCKHKYYLVMHMRTHTGEKPYKCAECPATFVNASNLNKHKLTHQEKQFKCMLCEKAFRTGTALWEHHDAKHMNIKHTCTFCGRDFCYKSDLRKHEIRSHNRIKRDYIGGEPTYKQVERLQKIQDDNDAMEKWRMQQIVVTQPQQTYIEHTKEFVQTTHSMYVSDVTGIMQQPILAQPQTVQLTLPDLGLKDEVKMYETQQGMAYF
ncbi:jg20721 [Pararge aegeria aegeria]|uniref:Jg20721 protein n=3 Tax=Pararge aegeria TaxID=116150 RepID=A0A8S4RRM7_9NEOP|nr:jg20721 [Pararge aegeria aegeria]